MNNEINNRTNREEDRRKFLPFLTDKRLRTGSGREGTSQASIPTPGFFGQTKLKKYGYIP
jgi:hypothetical protein